MESTKGGEIPFKESDSARVEAIETEPLPFLLSEPVNSRQCGAMAVPGLHDATATDGKGRNARHRAGDHPAGCRLAKLVANLGIHRAAPHYSHSD
jgi:hypothetical protein